MNKRFSRRQLFAAVSTILLNQLTPWSGQCATRVLNNFGRTIRFGVLADPHVDIRGRNGWRMGGISVTAMKKTVEALNLEPLDFVLIPGDLLLDGEWENLQVAKGLLDTLTAPYFIISGNHDYRPVDPNRMRKQFNYLNTEEFISEFAGHGYNQERARYWTQPVVPGLRVIALDGCLREEKSGWGGVLPQSQFLWLENQLRLAGEPVIIMVHHCLLHWGDDKKSVEGRWYSLQNSKEVRRLLTKYREKIVMVISGHRHIGLHYLKLGGVPYFVVPSINSYPMRYVLFELQSARMKWTTPQVEVGKALHEKAREGLLRAPWFVGLGQQQKRELLAFYENEMARSGALLLER